MSATSEEPWSSGPNAPQISYYWYFEEKTNFAGIVVSTILYGMRPHAFIYLCSLVALGIVVAQFFQCMNALLDRKRREIKWGLMAHTVVMFTCVTVYTAGGLYLQSTSYIDERAFPGVDTIPPGPIGYQYLIIDDPLNSICYVVFYLNQWLADGLLVSSISKSLVQVPEVVAPSAVPLLCYFRYELLVHHLTMPDVPRFYGCVVDLSLWGTPRLTSLLIQQWDSSLSARPCDLEPSPTTLSA